MNFIVSFSASGRIMLAEKWDSNGVFVAYNASWQDL